MLGIGGGGDVVGSLAIARRCEELETPFVVGGVAWERLPVDPKPGPRPANEIRDGGPARPARVARRARRRRPSTGVRFSESHVAEMLGVPTVLIDITGGAPGAAEGIAAAAGRLGCDLVVYVDVGGDAIAAGDEPGLASPLCDAIMLAAGLRLAGRLDGVATVIGAGCDGELTADEVLARVAALARAGRLDRGLERHRRAGRRARARRAAPPAARRACRSRAAPAASSATAAIRDGRRTVPLGPLGALGFCFDLEAAAAELPLAVAVRDAEHLDGARDALAALGVRTELDYELDRARGSAG